MEKAAYPADPVFASFPLIRKVFSTVVLINRPGVAGAVLQSPL